MKELIAKFLFVLACCATVAAFADLTPGLSRRFEEWRRVRETNVALHHDCKMIMVPENEWRIATNILDHGAIVATNRIATLRNRRKKKIEEKRSRGLKRVSEIREIRQAAKEGLIQ
jgi:hypothetical protein